jgi:hypothetical protein
VTARRVAAALAMAGVALLAVAEFSTVFEVTVGSLGVVKRSSTGGEHHGYALLVIAGAAVAMVLWSLGAGGRPAALALVALGAAALVVALAIDLPDTRGSGQLPESLAYENARARAATGLGLEIAGGVLLLVAGGGLAAAGRPGPAAPRRGRRDERAGEQHLKRNPRWWGY